MRKEINKSLKVFIEDTKDGDGLAGVQGRARVNTIEKGHFYIDAFATERNAGRDRRAPLL